MSAGGSSKTGESGDGIAASEDARRIAVANFDAPEQTRVWLTLGASEATETLVGALRTALLLAETVVVDRNQLLDGIFFLAMTPDRLAWYLGREPGAPLPLVIDCQPLPSADPRRGTLDETRAIAELQYAVVASERTNRVSSALVALTGEYDRMNTHSQSVLEHEPSAAWRHSDPVLLPQPLWDRRQRSVLKELIEQRRRAWIEAIASGRVGVSLWNAAVPDLGVALTGLARELRQPPPLADALMTLRQRAPDGALDVPTRRALIVRWLDGETVDELVPARLDDDLRQLPHRERSLALRWWNIAYYEAICAKNDLNMLTLHNVAPRASDQDRELAWGLRETAHSRLALAWRRLQRRRPEAANLTVEGEIVEDLMTVSPETFHQLLRAQETNRLALWNEPTNRKMFDLALSVRSATGTTESRTRRVRIRMLRLLAFTLIALTLAVREADLIGGSGAAWAIAWVLLALAGGFPWDELAILVSMRPGRMQSTVRLTGTP